MMENLRELDGYKYKSRFYNGQIRAETGIIKVHLVSLEKTCTCSIMFFNLLHFWCRLLFAYNDFSVITRANHQLMCLLQLIGFSHSNHHVRASHGHGHLTVKFSRPSEVIAQLIYRISSLKCALQNHKKQSVVSCVGL